MKAVLSTLIFGLGSLGWVYAEEIKPEDDEKVIQSWKEVGKDLENAFGESGIMLQRKYRQLGYHLQAWKEDGKDTSSEAWHDFQAGVSDLKEQASELKDFSRRELQNQWEKLLDKYDDLADKLDDWSDYPDSTEEDIEDRLDALEAKLEDIEDADDEKFDESKAAIQSTFYKVADKIDYWVSRAAIAGEKWAKDAVGETKDARSSIIHFYERSIYASSKKIEEMRESVNDESREDYEALVKKRDEMVSKLKELREASAETWDEALDDFQAGWKDFKGGASKFSSKAGSKAKDVWDEIW